MDDTIESPLWQRRTEGYERKRGRVLVPVTTAGHTYHLTEKQAGILEYVRAHAHASLREVARAVGCSVSTVERTIRRFARLGIARAIRTPGLCTVWRVAVGVGEAIKPGWKNPVADLVGSDVEGRRHDVAVPTKETNREPREIQRGALVGTALSLWHDTGARLRDLANAPRARRPRAIGGAR